MRGRKYGYSSHEVFIPSCADGFFPVLVSFWPFSMRSKVSHFILSTYIPYRTSTLIQLIPRFFYTLQLLLRLPEGIWWVQQHFTRQVPWAANQGRQLWPSRSQSLLFPFHHDIKAAVYHRNYVLIWFLGDIWLANTVVVDLVHHQ